MDANLPKKEQIHLLHRKLSKKTAVLVALGIIASLSLTSYFLFFTGSTLKNNLEKALSKDPTVAPKTVTKNPFKPETQFVNPFDANKSVFYSLKQTDKK